MRRDSGRDEEVEEIALARGILARRLELAVLHHALVGAAEEMGQALRRSAYSPNIKERQDYSCALFDARGRLLAQAAHLPVHLGSMPASVAAVLAAMRLAPGEVAVVNDPYSGGTHLPDITVVAPVYAGRTLLGYTANRAHHADVGGAAPGSMSPQTDLLAEGLVLPPLLLRTARGARTQTFDLILANTRTPVERAGDLNAQIAACDRGTRRLREIAATLGRGGLDAAAEGLLNHSRVLMRRNLARLRPGAYAARERLEDDGAGARDITIAVKLSVSPARLRFDFSASASQVRGGVNAVRAVTESAVYYAALCFCEERPPINHGCFACIDVIAPEGSVVNARRPAPVAGGNVETSQRIVDVCLAALSRAAPGQAVGQSQGTMNNLTIGSVGSDVEPFAYYETIAGGCGADASADGADATHSHMTNTLNTPVEALEHACPLRIEAYALREGSGGSGQRQGGQGVVRRVRVLAPASFGLLTERRRIRPAGVQGGGPGAAGENRLVRADKTALRLPAKCQGELAPGDAIEIRTPGGGGHGGPRRGAGQGRRVSPR
ncbi:MAG: hydantoinase B/oxoprolinase family protein [Planctomycetes bacterium]|nr:hydantoinase B/oxoprolinase family protein [Planctomycetota bacterium]